MIQIASHNNNYHRFSSDNGVGVFAVVQIDGFNFNVYPDNAGNFVFNFKDFTKSIFKHKDSFQYNSDLLDDNQFRDFTANIIITNKDGSSESKSVNVRVFNGVLQRWECPFVFNEVINHSEIKIPHFTGYPMDYGLVNSSGLNRVLVSNGSSYFQSNQVRLIDNKCDGIYLKFHNSNWSYSYYLFEPIGKESFKTKSIGSISEKFSWTRNLLEIGKKGQRELIAMALVDYRDREIIKSLAKSDEVYLYTGEKGQTATEQNWLEVRVDLLVNETNKYNNFEQLIRIKLPQEETRTRI